VAPNRLSWPDRLRAAADEVARRGWPAVVDLVGLKLRGAVTGAAGRAIDRCADPLAVRDRRDNEHTRLLIAFGLREDDNCVDIGANRGEILRELVRAAPRGRHLAFEPLPDLAAELRREFPEVDVRECALSDGPPGRASFTHVPEIPELSGFRRRAYPGDLETRAITVATDALDRALPEGYVPALIKLDVEGAELQVLRGARETLRRHTPLLVFEHGAGGADYYGTRSEDVHDLLAEVGYRIFDIDGGGPYTREAFAALFDQPLWVFVAHP
jgi:FkbM family methyltransferase